MGFTAGKARHNTSGLPPIATDARTLRHFSRAATSGHASSAQSRGWCSLTFEPAQRDVPKSPFFRQADAVGGHPTQTIICAVIHARIPRPPPITRVQ
jgi:hypothetical protein